MLTNNTILKKIAIAIFDRFVIKEEMFTACSFLTVMQTLLALYNLSFEALMLNIKKKPSTHLIRNGTGKGN